MVLPYYGLPVAEWEKRTLELIAAHPLNPNGIYDVVLSVWNDIFKSRIGTKPFGLVKIYFHVHKLWRFSFMN